MTFARDANWSDLLAMMETIERQIKLLMDKPVQEEDEEFEQRLMRGISPDKLPLKYGTYLAALGSLHRETFSPPPLPMIIIIICPIPLYVISNHALQLLIASPVCTTSI